MGYNLTIFKQSRLNAIVEARQQTTLHEAVSLLPKIYLARKAHGTRPGVSPEHCQSQLEHY